MPESSLTKLERRKQHHREKCQQRIAAKRKVYVQNGLCVVCGGERDDKRYQRCGKCRTRKKERDTEYLQRGLCRNCGSEREDKAINHCLKCRKYQRISGLRKRYGIDVGDYNRMFESQGGVCWICKESEPTNGGMLHVDHDEQTGRVRGLLCGRCNRAIGLLQHSPALLRRAIEYLVLSEQDGVLS